MKSFLRRFVPARFIGLYHLCLAKLAAWYYGHPSERMLVIGVTGTNGKTTTCNLVAAIFEAAGYAVGIATTVNFKVGSETWLNDQKMTMLGRFKLQKLLRRMVDAGCSVAVVETSSLGVSQHRHVGINYDVAAFTKLTPEHIEAHGGFDAYKAAKGMFFAWLTQRSRKTLGGKLVEKTAVVNVADDHAPFFLRFAADRKIGYRVAARPAVIRPEETAPHYQPLVAEQVATTTEGSTFVVGGVAMSVAMPGEFNVENCLAAIGIATSQGVSLEACARGLARVSGVPGRMERIVAGQPFTAIVDYAPEPASFAKLYEVVAALPHRRVIHVFGSTGGGRDRARRPVLGRIAGQHADVCIVTNEDPYDDNPMTIIGAVAAGCREMGKVEGESLFLVADRREAIAKAVSLCGEGDVLLVTGKGAEQAIAGPNGTLTPWDDRVEVRRAIEGTGK
jgi:UDP-N-acetylmuramoyl-L-alanyl-D-glutamate--2,6-diaminopimelate ligase